MTDPLEALFRSSRPPLPAGAVERVLASWKDPALAARYFWRDAGETARRALLPLALVLAAASVLLAVLPGLDPGSTTPPPDPFSLETTYARAAWPFVRGV